jgi:hypothetical protein
MSIESNQGVFDLTSRIYSVEELRTFKLSVSSGSIQDKTAQIAFQKLEKPQIPSKPGWGDWGVSILGGIKGAFVKNKDPTSIYNVTNKLDEVAGNLIYSFTQEQMEIHQLATPEERLEKVKNMMKKIGCAMVNLKNHDVIIDHFNARFLTKGHNILACHNHALSIHQMMAKLLEFGTLQTKLVVSIESAKKVSLEKQREIQREKGKVLDKTLNELEHNIQNGQEIDRQFIMSSAVEFTKSLADLEPQKAEECKLRYQGLVNKAYLETLKNKVIQEKMDLPQSISIVLSQLGFGSEWIKEKLPNARESLIKMIESQLADPELMKIPPKIVVQDVLAKVFGITSKLLELDQDKQKNLSALLGKLFAFESVFEKLHIDLAEVTKDYLTTFLTQQYGKDGALENEKLLHYHLSRLATYKSPSLFPLILEKAFTDPSIQLKINTLDQSDLFSQTLNRLEQHIEEQKNSLMENLAEIAQNEVLMFLEPMSTEKDQAKSDWFERNQTHTRFTFNQNEWGNQHILGGDGCCAAINFRWIKEIMKDPSRFYKSADDLNPAVSEQRDWRFSTRPLSLPSGSKILSKDRKIQAELRINVLVDKSGQGMSNKILKRDGMQKDILISYRSKPPNTITKLIEELHERNTQENLGLLDRSHGIIDLTVMVEKRNKQGQITAFENPHAIGMQIDPMSGTYRFWDVNSGFYSYPSLEMLKTESEAYMQAFYEGKYNNFSATQYIEEEKKPSPPSSPRMQMPPPTP